MLKYIKTLLPKINTSLVVKLSYIVFFATVPLTNSLSYIGYSLPIILLLVISLNNDGFWMLLRKMINNPLTYFFFYLILLNYLHNIAFVKTQIEIKLLCYILIMVATTYFLEHKIITLKFLCYSFLSVIFLLVIDGYWQYFFNMDFILHRKLGNLYYVTSAMEHWNSFGLLMVAAYMLVAYLLIEKSLTFIYIVLANAFILAILGMILLSGSRSSWLTTICFSIILLYFKRHDIVWKIWMPLILCIVSGISIISYSIPSIWMRIIMILQGNSSGRDSIWIYFLERIPENLIFGHGLTSPHYIESLESYYLYPHNLTIEIIYSFGLFGLIFCIVVFYQVMLSIYHMTDTYIRYYLFASFLAFFLCQQQFETSILIHKVAGPFLFFYLGIVYFLISKNKVNN